MEMVDEELKKFVMGIIRDNIEVHLILLGKKGINRKDIILATKRADKFMEDEIKKLTENDDDRANLRTLMAMILFHTNMRAYEKMMCEIAKECGVSKEAFENEMLIGEEKDMREYYKNK